jgi:hypothetical protein
MNSRVKNFSIIFSIIFSCLIIELIYLDSTSPSFQEVKNKNKFVSLVGLPDLAISTEASFIRHRTLVTTFDIFRDGAEHMEYFPTTFSISYGVKSEK